MKQKFKRFIAFVKARVWPWIKRKPRHAAVIGLVALLLLIMLVRSFSKSGPAQITYHAVKRGDFLISIVEGGTLKAVHEVTVRSELEGQARILSIVPEGTSVKKGDLLVELDSSDLRERLNQAEVTYQASKFAYVQAKENLTIQKSLIESNIKDAELKVEFALSDLEKYREGDWPQLRKNAETKITIADEELQRAADHRDWTVELQKKGYATKSELDADSLAVKRLEIQLEQAKEDLRLLGKYDYPKRTRLLESAVETARKELERLKARSNSQIASYEADLVTRNSTLELHQQRFDQLKEQLNLTKIYAPQDGLVIYASSSNQGSGVLIEEGATVRQKQEIIKLPDVTQMMVEIRVHESHVQKIKPGLSAYVTIDSLPEQQFKGVVRKVAVLPDASSRFYNPNLKVYATEVLISDDIPDIKPGISGRAEIVITNLTDVLTVPIQAVTTVKGRQVCFLGKGSSPTATPVEVGMYNDKYIEIKSGLKEGDRVMLAPQSAGDSIDLSGSILASNEDGESSNKLDKAEKMEKAEKASRKAEPPPASPGAEAGQTSPGGSVGKGGENPNRPDRPAAREGKKNTPETGSVPGAQK